jgi:formylmethanofuran:tetrahydromethanopterin formyltransferase
LKARGLDLTHARIVWEARDQEPTFGTTFIFTPSNAGSCWVEAEAQLPDGRRLFGVTNLTVHGAAGGK